MLKRCCNSIANFTLTLLKNKLTDKDKMKYSNNNNYVSKCYLKFFKIVPVKMESN